MAEFTLKLLNVSCASCVSKIENTLLSTAGVSNASINFAERTVTIEGDIKSKDAIKCLQQIGYESEFVYDLSSHPHDHHHNHEHNYNLLLKAITAGVCGFSLMFADWFNMLPSLTSAAGNNFWWLVAIIAIIICFFSGGHIYRGALSAAKNFSATMDTLITIGTLAAWIYSMIVLAAFEFFPPAARHFYFEASLVILSLVNFGAYLEDKARNKSSSAINKLLGLTPKTATVVINGEEKETAIADIKVGDIIRAKPGSSIALDGEIISGTSSVNESMLTGEPLAVSKHPGDKVYSGTINNTGSFLYKAEKIGSATVLSQIISIVRKAQNSKPPIAKIADKVSSIFVPAVILIAIITAIFWIVATQDPSLVLLTSVAVLVIACPCALGLATPISVTVAIGKAAESGIIVQNGSALEIAAKLNTVVIDKTGTITTGKPEVETVIPINDFDKNKVVQLAASLELASEHPLAQAVVSYAKKQQLPLIDYEKFSSAAGHGVIGKIDNLEIVVGNLKYLQQHQIEITDLKQQAQPLLQQGKICIFVAIDSKAAGVIAISDPVKTDSSAAIANLRALGIDVIMLTGDNQQTATHIAQKVGIDNVIAEVLPQDKAKTIEELKQQGKIVAMVGDGINDAPALVIADVGFALGAGTDIAIEASDVTIMNDSLMGVVALLRLSKATIRNIKQNLFGAFLYNSIGIPIAAGILYPVAGLLLNPMIAGAAMALSSLTVVSNANRLRFFK